MSIREVAQGRQVQGPDEKIRWSVDTTEWVASPASPSVTVTCINTGEDVTDDVTTGSSSVDGNVITLKWLLNLTAGYSYRVDVQFTAGAGAPYECYFYVDCDVA